MMLYPTELAARAYTPFVTRFARYFEAGETPSPKSREANAFERLASNAQEMLRLGRGLDEVLFVQGQTTHFVQDLNQPFHAAWGEKSHRI